MQCVYSMDWRLFRSWRFKSQLRGKRLGFNIFWLLLGLVTLVLGLGGGLFSQLYLLLAFFSLYNALLRWHLRAKAQFKRLAGLHGGDSWTRVIDFGQDRVAVTDGPSRTEYMYSDLGPIVESDGEAVLIFPKKARLVVYPASFTRGSWPECRELISNFKAAETGG